jgi:hypothetical protein
MLAAFNEILFKMPSAGFVSFHVEMQLEELFGEVCPLTSLPVFVLSTKEKKVICMLQEEFLF